ncbi:MAG: hypothetical protein AABY22_31420 [Nanoarchaeota archaeon]
MSTRSNIGIIHEDETVTFIYCHYDGYLECVGTILYENYSNLEKLYELMELGSISSLGSNIGTKHSFDNCPQDETNSYGRDRGEKDVSSRTLSNKYEVKKVMEEFLYLYDTKDKKWIFTGGGEFLDLEPEILKLKNKK